MLSNNPNNLDTLGTVQVSESFQKHEKVYTNAVKGSYQRARKMIAWSLLTLFFVLPWLSYGARPLVLFDLTQLRFHIFNITLWPQELYILSFILMIAAFGLFALTSWSGRVWCGFSCPQTVWTTIFITIERWLEGSRNKQIKRDSKRMNISIFLLKLSKHSLWLLVSFVTGYTFVAYFCPAKELFLVKNLLGLEGFWIAFFTLATYINAGYMREQVCKYMCPYSRFQSVMLTPNTKVVTYDEQRGEPRSSLKQNLETENKGDCINCLQCVHICPVGIDIRQGIQMDCINCGLCIDACDDVMNKLDRAPKLIKFQSENESQGKVKTRWDLHLMGYVSIFLILSSCLVYLIETRIPLKVDIIRERDHLFHETDAGTIENLYVVQIVNRDQINHDYVINIEGINETSIQGPTQVTIDAGQVHKSSLRLTIPNESVFSKHLPIRFNVTAKTDQSIHASFDTRFISP